MQNAPQNNSQPLPFISDTLLETYVTRLLDKAEIATQRASDELYENVVDPFSAVFDSMRQRIPLEEWLEYEKIRQIQKSLQNSIGEFHQNVLGSIHGWENLEVGNSIDLRNRNKRILAEVKNKHNTMNSSSQLALYDKLQRHLDYDESYHGFTAYCVVIVPKNPVSLDVPFHPSERGTQRPERKDIRMIDGRSFYEISTGDSNALHNLYLRLPQVIGKVTHTSSEEILHAQIFSNLFFRAYSLKNK